MTSHKDDRKRRAGKPRRRKLFAAGLIERCDNYFLIVRLRAPESTPSPWRFPREEAAADETPEAAMRRIALDWLGLYIEVIVGQPPLICTIDGEEVELRFMFCGVNDGDVDPGPDWESRWVLKGQLRDYEFDEPSQDVVDWMLAD